jgi:integration host factor subunit beta
MERSVTKSRLIEQISAATGLTKGRAEQVVNAIFESMTDALRRGEGIEIRGFGSFTVRQYKSYEGRNPRTGDTVHVAPKRLPFFKVGKELRERVNGMTSEGGRARARATRAALLQAQRPEHPSEPVSPPSSSRTPTSNTPPTPRPPRIDEDVI